VSKPPPILDYRAGPGLRHEIVQGVQIYSLQPPPIWVASIPLISLALLPAGLIAVSLAMMISLFRDGHFQVDSGPMLIICVGMSMAGVVSLYLIYRRYTKLTVYGREPVRIQVTAEEFQLLNPGKWGSAMKAIQISNIVRIQLCNIRRTKPGPSHFALIIEQDLLEPTQIEFFAMHEQAEAFLAALQAELPKGGELTPQSRATRSPNSLDV
jgi:hypothetical protein